MKSFLQYITEAKAIDRDGGNLEWEFVPEYPFPVDEDRPSQYWPIPLEPGDPGYVEPKIPPRWVNPYSAPVPIPFYGQPAWSPGFFQPMVNPNYQGPPTSIPSGIDTPIRPTPFLKPGGIYAPGRRKYPAIPDPVPRKFRF